MGICQSTKNKNKQVQQPKKAVVEDKENISPNKGVDKEMDAEFGYKKNQPATTRTPAVAINNDVIITRNDVNPELIYKKVKKLGSGAFGDVWLVKQKDLNKEFAMKVIHKRTKKASEEREIMNEIKILKTLDHPKILKIIDFYSTSTDYYLITEYCPLGELFHEIEKVSVFEEGPASFIMNQIFRAVSYCHGMNIIHRDLKPENIMISSREENKCLQIKIIDFGTAKTFEKGQPENRYVGSSYYVAPEVIQRKYNEKCDLWSCGVIMYILLTGRPPFEGDDDKEIIQKVKTGKYDTSTPPFPSLSYEAKDLIKKLLEIDVKKRISAVEALNHKWFQTSRFKDKDKVNTISTTLAKKLIENLKNYHSKNMVRCAVIAYLVHHNTNMQQCNEASKLFNKIDLNGDGKIEKHELLEGIMNYWKLPKLQIEKEVDVIFDNIDTDHNGYIEYEEFIRAAIDQDYFLTNNYLKFAFNYFDRDNSGELSIDEILKRFMQNAKNSKDPQVEKELRETFDSIDINHDGSISFAEFCKMMKNIISK